MKKAKVRIQSVCIDNIKNIQHGNVDFQPARAENPFDSASVIGLYGQNGSGKTTIIQALTLFKLIASEKPIWADMAERIRKDSESCLLSISFILQLSNGENKLAQYSCEIAKSNSNEANCAITMEQISIAKARTEGKFGTLVNIFTYKPAINPDKLFSPDICYNNIVQNQSSAIQAAVASKLSQEKHTSFLFSADFFSLLKSSKEKELAEIIEALNIYAKFNLFTILNAHSGLISIDAVIPHSIKHQLKEATAIGNIPISQQGPITADLHTFEITKSVLESMDNVIGALIPGLSIKIIEYGRELQSNGSWGIRYEVVSNRQGQLIPIRYESEGVRKILSILNLVIAMYNNDSVCVAIDELDAGIFEIMLGDLLKVLLENGKGQLIFTSHNLRPLEVLEKENIYFTTTNPKNRFIHLKNIRPTNNLRDCYIRALNLGGQDEELATTTKQHLIRRALRKSGNNDVEN